MIMSRPSKTYDARKLINFRCWLWTNGNKK